MDSTSRGSWFLLAAVALGGIFYMGGQKMAAVEEHRTPPSITVTGEGKVSAAPDIASLSFGVTTGRRTTAKEAISMLSTRMQAIMAAVEAAGIEEKDIASEQFSLSPEYSWTAERQTIIGYTANQMLRVKVRDLDKVSDVLAAATGAGANQAGDVNFMIDEPEEARAAAREEAIAQAKEKAEVIAKQLGLRLTKITGYNEDGGGYYPPSPYLMRAEAMSDGAQANVPLPAGEQDVMVNVSLTYELR